jgi:hypothetical protein
MPSNQRLNITYQTLYSELVQRSLDESFTPEVSSNGRFVAVAVKAKKYWYFDKPKLEGGGQDRRYVGSPRSAAARRRRAIRSPERYATHKLVVGSRRKDRDATAKNSKDRRQAKSIIEAMI